MVPVVAQDRLRRTGRSKQQQQRSSHHHINQPRALLVYSFVFRLFIDYIASSFITMASKKITVDGVGGVKLSNDNEFYFWLSKKHVESLVDSEGDEVVGFESLTDGGTYTLGPPEQQQQQDEQELPLQLFELVYTSIPTGSSGVPHIHENLNPFPMEELKPLVIQENNTRLRRFNHVSDEQTITYTRELIVQSYLHDVVKDVIRSCRYDLKTDEEAALNGLKVDVGMIRNRDDIICGTMEVKQPQRKNVAPPDPDPMNHPKVITQVLSQMIPLRTMYGVQNVYGILSTYSSWRFFRWAPVDEDIGGPEEDARQKLEDRQLSEPQKKHSVEEDKYRTSQKLRSKSELGDDRSSPPMSPKPYVDTGECDEEEDEELDDSTKAIKHGTLYASAVISDGALALRTLAWVLGEMERSPVKHVPAHERDFLYVVKMNDALGGYEKVEHDDAYYKGRMPNSKNQKLYMLEELGHRHHGRVYRAMSRNGNLCVLKYFVKEQYAVMPNGNKQQINPEAVASKSVEYWNKAYEKWLPRALAGKWGGGDAIIMPDLEKMSVLVEPMCVLPMLRQTMKERFYDQGIWHGDAAWRNVALVRNEKGDVSKVCMIDLEPQGMIEKVQTSLWKEFETMWAEFKGILLNDWERFKAAEAK